MQKLKEALDKIRTAADAIRKTVDAVTNAITTFPVLGPILGGGVVALYAPLVKAGFDALDTAIDAADDAVDEAVKSGAK